MPTGLRPLLSRNPAEGHRAATQLELFFDLVSVIAIAAVTETLHHGISEAHGLPMLVNFIALFVVIWWAWMNYTWFASAFDNGDMGFVLLTFVIITGALVFAGAVSGITTSLDFGTAIFGWIIMRVGMIGLWLRAAADNPAYRRTALRYAGGIALAQILWIVFYLMVPAGSTAFLPLYALIFGVELLVPVQAERAHATPWHRHHIIERYGLLNIIVLGEVMVSLALIFGKIYDGHLELPLVVVGLSGLVVVFSLWWFYFVEPEHLKTTDLPRALLWGYGHVLVFGCGALVAAGLGAVMDVAGHHSEISATEANRWLAAPVAGYLFALWLIRDRCLEGLFARYSLLAGAALIGVLALIGAPVWVVAIALVLLVGLRAQGVQAPSPHSA